jgi:hypothetical protein
MEKLTLQHLSGYLPYGLKIEHPTLKIGSRTISELKNLGQTNIEISHRMFVQISDCKPILHPLSDLTKEIEVNGEKFVPLVKMAIRYANSTGYNDKIGMYNGKCYCYSKSSELEFRFDGHDFLLKGQRVQQQFKLFEKLYEWHFDIHGLIDNNLAIDINTLTK